MEALSYRQGSMKFAILLPTYNEEESLPFMVKALKSNYPDADIFVLDGGSEDSTRELAKKMGCNVMLFGRGKGRALREAFKKLNYETLCVIDCDASYPSSKIKDMLNAEGDFVLAERVVFEKNSISWLKRLGNKFLTLVFNLLYGTSFKDVLSGMYMFKNYSYKKLSLEADGFDIEVDILSNVVKRKLSIATIPISYLPRKGKSKISIFHGIPILMRMIRNRFRSS